LKLLSTVIRDVINNDPLTQFTVKPIAMQAST